MVFSTPVSKVMNIKDVAQRAKSYGMDEIVVDGNDVVAVYDTVKNILILLGQVKVGFN